MLERTTTFASFFSSSASTRTALAALLALAAVPGCAVASTGDDTTFQLPEPLAAGASTVLAIYTSGTIDHATSSDPSVVTVPKIESGEPAVTAGAPGTATLTLYDASNAVVGRGNVTVAATSKIALDPGVTTTGIAVLLGESHPIHATTIAADGTTLVGDGAIQFAYEGSVGRSLVAAGCDGDCAEFQANAKGDGAIVMTATASNAKTVVSLHVVTAIDTFTIAQSSVDAKVNVATTVPVAITAGGAPAWTTTVCTSADPNTAQVFAGTPFGPSTPNASLNVVPMAVGSTSVTCTTAGLTQSFTVNVK